MKFKLLDLVQEASITVGSCWSPQPMACHFWPWTPATSSHVYFCMYSLSFLTSTLIISSTSNGLSSHLPGQSPLIFMTWLFHFHWKRSKLYQNRLGFHSLCFYNILNCIFLILLYYVFKLVSFIELGQGTRSYFPLVPDI